MWSTHAPFTRRTETGDTVPTALRFGTLRLRRNGRWRGWGYRKVYAEHGWGVDEQVATQQALSTPPQPHGFRGADAYTNVYVGPDYEQNGTICARIVVVANPQRSSLSHEPHAREIINSYGWDKLRNP
jgi:hypothetical protein